MTRFVIAAAVLLTHFGNPLSASPPKIDRTLKKEPAYKSPAPKYGLLGFGPQAADRVWLVVDGNTLYVDRNGNGDLTEAGEKVEAERSERETASNILSFQAGAISVGGRVHKGLSISFIPLKLYADGEELGKRPDVRAVLEKDAEATTVVLSVDVEMPELKGGGIDGRINFVAGPVDQDGVFQFTGNPADAPVVHLGGPLQIDFHAALPSMRVGRTSEFVLVVGTPGIGPGTFAMVGYQDTIPESAKPVAEITYRLAKPSDPPFKEKYEIKERC